MVYNLDYRQEYIVAKAKYLNLKQSIFNMIGGKDTIDQPINLLKADDETIKKLDPGVVVQYNLSGLKHIIKHGYPINKQSKDGWTILHFYARRSPSKTSLNAFKFLIEKGADPTIKTDDGYTALDIAQLFNKPIANLLLKKR